MQKKQINGSELYPVVRGRLTELNSKPIIEAVNPVAKENRALYRVLNLTWSDTVPDTNKVVTGDWWDADTSSSVVSIEETLAEKLGLTLGDFLSFQVGADTLKAKITSIRKVKWFSFQPNFYFIFPKKTLSSFPNTSMNSFYLGLKQKSEIAE